MWYTVGHDTPQNLEGTKPVQSTVWAHLSRPEQALEQVNEKSLHTQIILDIVKQHLVQLGQIDGRAEYLSNVTLSQLAAPLQQVAGQPGSHGRFTLVPVPYYIDRSFQQKLLHNVWIFDTICRLSSILVVNFVASNLFSMGLP